MDIHSEGMTTPVRSVFRDDESYLVGIASSNYMVYIFILTSYIVMWLTDLYHSVV